MIRQSPRYPYSPGANGFVDVRNTPNDIFKQFSSSASKVSSDEKVFHTRPQTSKTFDLNFARIKRKPCISKCCPSF